MAGRSRVSELTGHGQREILKVVWPVDRQDVFFLSVLYGRIVFFGCYNQSFFCLLVLATVLYFCLKSLHCYWLFDE